MNIRSLFQSWVAVLLVAGVSLAVTVPILPDGPTFLASRNVDNATVYIPTDPGLIGQTVDPDNLPAGVTAITPRGGLAGEDSWGLAVMYQIAEGYVKSDGTIGGNTIYYDNSAGLSNTWLVGMFWGGHDYSVSFKNPPSPAVSSFTVLTDSLQFELWAVDKTALDSAVMPFPEMLPFSAADRTAANRYSGWMEDAMLAGSAVKLLRGESTFMRFNGDAFSTATPGVYRFAGDALAYFDIDETDSSYLWNSLWGTSGGFTDPAGNAADMYFSWDLETGDTWDTLSRDFGGVIPDPLTIALIGLGGIILLRRKR